MNRNYHSVCLRLLCNEIYFNGFYFFESSKKKNGDTEKSIRLSLKGNLM